MIIDYLEIQNQLSELETKKRGIENVMKDFLKDNEKATYGEHFVSWKSTKPRETFDAKAFKDDYPELHKKYIKVGEPSRRMDIK